MSFLIFFQKKVKNKILMELFIYTLNNAIITMDYTLNQKRREGLNF